MTTIIIAAVVTKICKQNYSTDQGIYSIVQKCKYIAVVSRPLYSMLKAEMPTFEYKFPGDSYRAVNIIAIEHMSTNAGRGGCKLTIGEECEIF